VTDVVQRLRETICGYILGTHVLKGEMAIFDLILDVVVVDIDVFSALIVALARCKLDRGLVITVELHGTNVGALIANLLQQAGKPGGFFSSVSEANVLCFRS
jgi:hypothetical protein